jgi:hypothetical protein
MNIENPQPLVQGGEYIIYNIPDNSNIRGQYLGFNNEFGNNIFVFKPTDRRMGSSLLKIPENRMNQYQILLPDDSDPDVFIGNKKLLGPPRRLLSDVKIQATNDDDAMEIGGRRKSRRRRTKRYRKKRSTRRKRAKK